MPVYSPINAYTMLVIEFILKYEGKTYRQWFNPISWGSPVTYTPRRVIQRHSSDLAAIAAKIPPGESELFDKKAISKIHKELASKNWKQLQDGLSERQGRRYMY
jgi:hypothetical protein